MRLGVSTNDTCDDALDECDEDVSLPSINISNVNERWKLLEPSLELKINYMPKWIKSALGQTKLNNGSSDELSVTLLRNKMNQQKMN